MKKILLLLLSFYFFSAASAQKVDLAAARTLVNAHGTEIGLSKKSLDNYAVSSSYINEGTQMVYLIQTFKGLPVYNQMLTLAFKNDRVISNAGAFIENIEEIATAKTATPSVTPTDAVNRAFAEQKLLPPVLGTAKFQGNTKFDFGITPDVIENITGELKWFPVEISGKIFSVNLVWEVVVEPKTEEAQWHIFVDALTGIIIDKKNHVIHDHFGVPASKPARSAHLKTAPTVSALPGFLTAFKAQSPAVVQSASYLVIPYPAESPIHPGGTPAVRTDPWTAAPGNASTLGWHSTGASDFNITRGNNVWATEDVAATSSNSGSAATSTTSPNLTFNFPPNFTQAPSTLNNQFFAITNLFYLNNIIHDITYQYGFNEPAGNYQVNNLSRGGLGGDDVSALAQSGGANPAAPVPIGNNANFTPSVDGVRGRMRMYLFNGIPANTNIHVNAPASAVADHFAVEGSVSTQNLLFNLGPRTGQVVYYDDGTGANEACGTPGTPTNNIAGKIVMINRGNCTFVEKIKNAQNAGAIGVIMVQVTGLTGAPNAFGMAGDDNTIVIPAVAVSVSIGAILAAQIPNGLNVTLSTITPAGPPLDGDLDAGIVYHEFTHGLSNRLTGGPSTASCLNNTESAGEGWSDYFGLMLTTNWATATLTDGPNPRPIGNYALGDPLTADGIRNYPYSTSLTVNPLMYSHMGLGAVLPWKFSNGSEIHNTGEIFCAALWDMTWGIIQQEAAINTNLYNYSPTGNGGNSIALKLVLEGMKLQPCSPGFISARDAILTADRNLYAGRHACAIWTAFAKRGMGFGALQGSSNSTTDHTPSSALPPAPAINAQPGSITVAQGGTANFTVGSSNTPASQVIYNWQVSTDGGTVYNDVNPSNITTTLSISNVTCAMNGNKYRARVFIGCAITVSDVVTLTVSGCVTAPQITLSSAAGTNVQTVCTGAAISPVTYTTSGGVTGVTATGLPAGVTGTYSGGSNGTFTISGIPTTTGIFNFTVTTSGGTPIATSTGTITVNPTTTLTLTSAAGTTTQTVTLTSAITNITYSTGGGVTCATVTGLPAGVTGVYSGGTNGTVTISGTPTAVGTFNYTVTTSGGCGVQTALGTITVVNGPSITLSSATGTSTQTVCVNTAITNITYTTAGGVTGASVTGLPAGVTGIYSGGTNGTVTISGTPTATGTFSYTVTTSGGTSTATATGTITVNGASTLTLTSAAGTTNQTVNINTPITNITYNTGSGVTGATVTGLPAGVTGTYSGGTNGTVTISGTPTVSGTFNYTVTTSGGCGVQTVTGTITVNLVPTITLSSAAGTNSQSVCVNTAITNITYTTAGGVTGATVTGLPAGVTGTYSGGTNGTFTISGTPTATGPFSYTVTTSGGVSPATATGTITVNGATTLTLSSAAGTNTQTVCANAAITNITYSTTGGVTGATVTGLPAGVTSSFAGSTITISGTPTASGTFNYTVTTTGGCGVQTATGTITVNPAVTITLTSAAGTNNQTRCINTAITNITYSTANGVTSGTVTGLPAGVTGTYSGGTNGTVTISGTPTATGTFNYTVTTSGGCGPATATGSIIVNPTATITLSSAAGTNSQSICINSALTNITYTVNAGVTGAVISAGALPAGVTGITGTTFTISGTPTAVGTFNYTVSTTGGCGTAPATGTITVNPAATIALTSAASTNNQTVCSGGAITNITYSTANGATGATVTGLPAGVTGTYAGGVFTISGTPAVSGVFNYTVSTTGGCGVATATGMITATSGPVITAQPQNITSCTTTATFSVTATGAGLSYVWQVSTNGGVTFTNITPAQTSSTLVVTGLTPAQANNRYRVVITSACGSVTSNEVTAQVGTPPVVVLTASPSTAFNPSLGGGLYATVSPVGNYVYQWKRNGQILQNVLGPSLTAANGLLFEFGTYQVTAIDVTTGCAGVSNSVTITDVATDRNQLFISPNPTTGIVNVSYYSSTTAAQARGIEVYDSKGSRVMIRDFSVTGTYGTMILDLTKMVEGTYMIVLRDASGKMIASERVIKF
ncbi:MAG: M36 family metallopeptidase [Ferruginibacter sp.]